MRLTEIIRAIFGLGEAEAERMAALADLAESLSDDDAAYLSNQLSERQSTQVDSDDITGDLVPLVEKAVKEDGSATIKIIAPGQGSSGYYPADVLQRDGPTAFPAGTHIYLDHPSITEERDRPERSVRDLAGSTTGPAEWRADGLYAPVRFVDSVAPHINSIAAISGMSIRASGKAGTREVDGKKVRSIESIDVGHSIDVVTRPGAGGKVLDLIESARGRQTPIKEVDDVSQDELKALQEKLADSERRHAELAAKIEAAERREAEAQLLRQAAAIVTEALSGITLPTPTRARLQAQLTLDPPLKEGALDAEALKARVKETADAELAYLAEAAGGSGRIVGMGGEAPKPDAIPALEESGKRIAAALQGL